jgi:hypothetical protein
MLTLSSHVNFINAKVSLRVPLSPEPSGFVQSAIRGLNRTCRFLRVWRCLLVLLWGTKELGKLAAMMRANGYALPAISPLILPPDHAVIYAAKGSRHIGRGWGQQ